MSPGMSLGIIIAVMQVVIHIMFSARKTGNIYLWALQVILKKNILIIL